MRGHSGHGLLVPRLLGGCGKSSKLVSDAQPWRSEVAMQSRLYHQAQQHKAAAKPAPA